MFSVPRILTQGMGSGRYRPTSVLGNCRMAPALASDEPETVIDALAAQRTACAKLHGRLKTLYDTVGELGPVHAGDRTTTAGTAPMSGDSLP